VQQGYLGFIEFHASKLLEPQLISSLVWFIVLGVDSLCLSLYLCIMVMLCNRFV
jgi:hypothetical protein